MSRWWALAAVPALAVAFAAEAEYPAVGLVAAGVLCFCCGAYARAAPGLAVVAALELALVAGERGSWVPITFALAGPWAAGRAVRARAQLVAALAERTRELEREQQAFTRLTVQHERARIARELHDIVAHHLAVMVVQAGAGRMAAGDPPEVQAQRFAGIREAGTEALSEMDRLLDLLEHAPEPLQRLLDRARAAGLTVRARSEPAGLELDATAIRIVQEALTNVLKHAPGAAVEVAIEQRESTLAIAVEDRGATRGGTLAATGAGLGLRGLGERVSAAGGRLDAGPARTGWRVYAELPRTPAGAGEVRH
jgi:signal transduction histidine kinase